MIGDDEEFFSLAQPRQRTFSVQHAVLLRGARIGEVRINGEPSTQIANCVVDRETGLITFGTFEDALRARARAGAQR